MGHMKLTQITNEKWINLVRAEGLFGSWTYATRNKDIEAKPTCNAVFIAALTLDDQLIVTREYRPPIKDYEIAIPAGLIDEGETVEQAAKRELKEETGLDLLEVLHISPLLAASAGGTDECVKIVWCKASGTLSSEYLEVHEDIMTRAMDYAEVAYQVRAAQNSDAIISDRAYGVFLQYLTQRGWKLDG